VVESLSQRVVGRMAAVLFVVAGCVSLEDTLTPTGVRFDWRAQLVVALIAIGLGVWCWVAPWQRWPVGRTLWLAPAGLALLGLTAAFGSYNAYTYAAYFVVVYTWIGVSQPRGTSLKLLPVAAAAYVLPLAFRGEPGDALLSGGEVMVICAAVGEALAWVSSHLRAAERLDASRMWEMQGLLQAGEVLARETDAARAPTLVADLAAQLMRAERVLVLMPEDEGSMVAAGTTRWPEADGLRLLPGDAPEPFKAYMEAEPRLIPSDTGWLRALGVEHGTAVLASLRGTAGSLGVLIAAVPDQIVELPQFTEHLVRSFATQAGLTLDRLNAAEALLRETLRDELTGVGNRRYANVMLSRLTDGDAVVVIDLDHFKQVNDEHGHAAGDDALRAVAAHLGGSLREGDAAARYGGDEFLVILRGAGPQALDVAERIARRWRMTNPPVDFSMGVAVIRAGETPDNAFHRADAALYDAKGAGRGRAVLAGEVNAATSA
jgi:diguanylate cyclase (GGDEF)-like protein